VSENPTYLKLEKLIELIDKPYKKSCRKLLETNLKLFGETFGSLKNHQAYPGGYIHHLEETMNIAVVLYSTLHKLRPLGFLLSDALLILYLHDIEKPWKYEKNSISELEIKASLFNKEDQYTFQLAKIEEYGIKLTEEHKNALRFINGEADHYTYFKRTRGPLAAFCGTCDSISARIWFDYPSEKDTWKTLLEDIEGINSPNYIKSIQEARKSSKLFSAKEVKKQLNIE